MLAVKLVDYWRGPRLTENIFVLPKEPDIVGDSREVGSQVLNEWPLARIHLRMISQLERAATSFMPIVAAAEARGCVALVQRSHVTCGR